MEPIASAAVDIEEGSPYVPGTVDPSALLESEEGAGEGSAAERLDALYARMRPYRRQLDGVLEHCRQAHALAELEQVQGCVPRGVYDTASLVRLLVRAGGLEEQAVPAAEPQVVEIDGVPYLDPAPAAEAPTRFVTTEAGLARLTKAGDLGVFEKILAEEPRYEHVYRILLDVCANEGGATAKQLDDAVIDDPELQEPRMYASYFYDRLDAAGLIEWTGSWTATALGRTAIAQLDELA